MISAAGVYEASLSSKPETISVNFDGGRSFRLFIVQVGSIWEMYTACSVEEMNWFISGNASEAPVLRVEFLKEIEDLTVTTDQGQNILFSKLNGNFEGDFRAAVSANRISSSFKVIAVVPFDSTQMTRKAQVHIFNETVVALKCDKLGEICVLSSPRTNVFVQANALVRTLRVDEKVVAYFTDSNGQAVEAQGSFLVVSVEDVSKEISSIGSASSPSFGT